jgi:hypothetical protein
LKSRYTTENKSFFEVVSLEKTKKKLGSKMFIFLSLFGLGVTYIVCSANSGQDPKLTNSTNRKAKPRIHFIAPGKKDEDVQNSPTRRLQESSNVSRLIQKREECLRNAQLAINSDWKNQLRKNISDPEEYLRIDNAIASGNLLISNINILLDERHESFLYSDLSPDAKLALHQRMVSILGTEFEKVKGLFGVNNQSTVDGNQVISSEADYWKYINLLETETNAVLDIVIPQYGLQEIMNNNFYTASAWHALAAQIGDKLQNEFGIEVVPSKPPSQQESARSR